MTREKWAKMNDRAKNCLVGSLSGLKYRDYTQDLNAMHEALITASERDIRFVEKWLWFLAEVISKGETHDYAEVGKWELINATAEQRADAFILTVEPE